MPRLEASIRKDRNMKKIVLITVLVAATILLLVGCGGGGGKSNPVGSDNQWKTTYFENIQFDVMKTWAYDSENNWDTYCFNPDYDPDADIWDKNGTSILSIALRHSAGNSPEEQAKSMLDIIGDEFVVSKEKLVINDLAAYELVERITHESGNELLIIFLYVQKGEELYEFMQTATDETVPLYDHMKKSIK